MDSREIAPYRPLPPQRWGFLPTNEFWHHAALTPISLIFWGGVAVFFSFFDFSALAWWQQSFAWMVVWWVWAGLVERFTRRYLARRQLRALTSRRTELAEGLGEATVEAPPNERALAEPAGPPSRTLVRPGAALRAKLGLVQRVESFDLAFAAAFGRGAGVAQFAFQLAFGLAIFHPSGWIKLLGVLALVGVGRWIGAWERRQALAADVGGGREALAAGVGAPGARRGACDATRPQPLR